MRSGEQPTDSASTPRVRGSACPIALRWNDANSTAGSKPVLPTHRIGGCLPYVSLEGLAWQLPCKYAPSIAPVRCAGITDVDIRTIRDDATLEVPGRARGSPMLDYL